MRKMLVTALLLPALACVQSRLAYTEPAWGDAPAPIPIEITEVSMERMDCSAPACVYIRTTMRRDGRAERTYRTGKEPDSTFVGAIDSASFNQLASGLIKGGFWKGGDSGGASYEEFQSHGVLVSAASLCRRQVGQYTGKYVNAPIVRLVDSAAAGIPWQECCGADAAAVAVRQ